MDRRKLSHSWIEDRRKRFQTFQKRRKGLEKKAYELSTLCDVNVVMIMLGPDDVTEGSNVPAIWPEDPNVVSKMISLYQEKEKTDKDSSRNVDVASICQDKARRVRKEIEKLMEQNVDAKYESLSNDELLQIGNELDNVLEGLKSRIDYVKNYPVFQELPSSYGNRGKEEENCHQLQGLNYFNCFGNEGDLVLHNSQTMNVKDEGSSYCDSYYNNIVPANLDYYVPSLPGYGHNFEQNNIIMDEGSSYCNSYNNIVPSNFDYNCPSLPEFRENFEQNNNNVIMNQQPEPQYLSYTPAPMPVFNPEPQFPSYTSASLQMPEFKPCPLSSLQMSEFKPYNLSSSGNYSNMDHGAWGYW